MVMLSLVLALAAPALCASAGEIDVSFADKSYQKIFGEDFSWDQRNNEAKYFDVGNYGNRKALRIRIYEGDKTAWQGNPSCPRSELRPRTRDMLKTDTDYTAEWDWQLQQYTPGYVFNFMQLYGGAPRNRPNVMLRLGSHNKQGYNVLCEQCSKPGNDFNIPGNAGDDIGKWIKWRVEFRLSTSSHGYLRFYHNGKQVYKYSGKTSDGSNHNWKTGVYTQGHPDCKVKNTVAYLSNLRIRPTGSVAVLNSTNGNPAESDADLYASSVLV
jgi:hypothetical protein